MALQNVTPESMIFTPFWVQAYRLPFLSKSRSLAKSLGNLLGEFVTVFEDSLNEGWGPFLRFKVRLDITKPLLRGKMISLPKVRDEFWLEFRYERLPNYCMECGVIGHLYQKCPQFLENIDNGIEPELSYGPTLNGSPLPSSSYDRYRSDFSKGNAWPLLTRLARNSLTATLPRINHRPPAHPQPLLIGEGSNARVVTPPYGPNHATTNNQNMAASTIFTPGVLTNSSLISTTSVKTTTFSSSSTDPIHTPSASSSLLVTSATHIDVYIPDIGIHSTNIPTTQIHLPFATYPPTDSISNNLTTSVLPMPFIPNSTSTTQLIISGCCHAQGLVDQENVNPNCRVKRQKESKSLRQTLKRCRGSQGLDTSSFGDFNAIPLLIMKLLSWNARGLGNSSAFRRLQLLVSEQSPQVLLLMETKLCDGALSRFKLSLNFNNGLEVSRVGLKGGIMLLWKDGVDVTLLSMNTNHFDCYVLFDDGPRWHLSAIYGFPEAINKKHTWALIRRLADVSPLDPWLLIGDINEIFAQEHKSCGPLRPDNQMQAFRSTMDQCFLNALHVLGDDFTWAKNRKRGTGLKERIDWCLINNVWKDSLVHPILTHLDYYGSDHRVLSAEINFSQQQVPAVRRKSRFRFEKIWLKDEECCDIISRRWFSADHLDPAAGFRECVERCSKQLQDWHIKKYGKMKKKISKAQKEVSRLNSVASVTDLEPAATAAHVQAVQSAECILEELLANEEQYWHQRSRVEWLQSGDRNTKFFHSKASARRSNNKIKELRDVDGSVITSKDGIAHLVADYFSKLFTATDEDHWALSHVLSTIPTTISPQQNDSLLLEFTGPEVYAALKSMGSDKSPGVDGLSAMFYQNYWHIVGDLVTKVVLNVLNHGGSPEAFNKTLITLIPKIKKPKEMKDFRPISLCNVIYKIISKMLATRFKEVLPSVISKTQSAFLSNRLITDNILVAFELIHNLKHRKRGSNGYATLKLDMSKAFDRVEWSFIAAVMSKMGFNIRWISLIMSCLHTNSFSFIINGEVTGLVTPQRGLRQGDPLLKYEEQIGRLKGLAVSRHSPTISHLLFADDSLLFCQANDRSCGAIKRALDIYHRASGQQLNADKSVMSFSPNTPESVQNSFQQILGMPICECHESYLGLPAYSERDKSQLFSNIKEKIWKLMHAWNDKIFSIGGKEVLLKAVVQSIPTYAMSCFRLSAKFCKEIEAMMARFWWGSTSDNKEIHWKKWRFLCKSKGSGATGGGLSSITWQGIVWGRELLAKGLRLKVGTGSSISCVDDSWIPGHKSFKPYCYTGDHSNVVADYISSNREWNLELLNTHFSPHDVEHILTIPLSFLPTNDRWIWHYDVSGDYSVSTGYNFASSLEEDDISSCSHTQETWWKAWESIGHALFSCCHAKDVWTLSGFIIDFSNADHMSDGDYLMHLSTIYSKQDLECILCLMWFIWSNRNSYIHATSTPVGGLRTSPIPTAKWQPPPENNYKLNVDAALDSSRSKIGIGVIVRNSAGQVVGAMSKPAVGNFKSQEMEAKAMFVGLSWAKQYQIPIDYVETDCLMLVNALNGCISHNSSFFGLVSDVTFHLSSFSNVCVSHVKRDANQAAHNLAKQALQLDNDCMWLGEIPSTIFSVVVNNSL
uniref:Reverse transcriptase n=1 Tax=Cannabis sativa TaxID=3483 RepID=A0A803P9C5_CANSA